MCCKGCQYNPNEALGLPPKSVRAIIGIISCLLIYFVETYIVISLMKNDQFDLAIAVGGAMLAELSGIIGYYFGSRSSATPNTLNTDQGTYSQVSAGIRLNPIPDDLIDLESQRKSKKNDKNKS